MEDNKELLTYIIENQIFASSWSALAKHLGYKGRMAFSRLKGGNIKLSTVENIMTNICDSFEIPYNELIAISEMVRKGKIIFSVIKDESIYSDDNAWADKVLTDFVTLNFQDYSDDFNLYITPHLKELHANEPYVYFGVVMVMYIKLKRINPYAGNTGHFHKLLKSHTSHICSVLKEHIPENATGQCAAMAYMSDNIIKKAPQCIWGLLVYNIHVLRYFADPDYINQILEFGAAFEEWKDFSYWHESNVPYAQGAKLWTFFFRESNSPLHGMYIAQTFEAGKDNETFIPKENFLLIFLEKDNEDDEYATVQVNNIANNGPSDYTVYYGKYRYEEDEHELTIIWDDEKENFLEIPSRLKRITMEKPDSKDEQIWTHIIRKFDNNNSSKIFSETLLDKLNTEYLDDVYDIQNVTISRRFFSLTISTDNQTKEYSIPIDAYPFLKNVRVFDEVTIKKDTSTGKLFVCWTWVGYEIPMKEFSVSSCPATKNIGSDSSQ